LFSHVMVGVNNMGTSKNSTTSLWARWATLKVSSNYKYD